MKSLEQQTTNTEQPGPHPPRWAQQIVEWYARPELAEDLLGDLNEYFQRNVLTKGPRRAKLIYIIDAFKFFRTYTVRKPKFINFLINWIMIGSYIKTSARNLMRNKLFSFINVIGLAISMSVGLLMISFLHDLFSYDKFHEKGDRMYRVTTLPVSPDEESSEFATTSLRAAALVRERVPGIGESTIMRQKFDEDALIGDNMFPLSGMWADGSFFEVFTFPMIEGNPKTALQAPYSIVLTEHSAKRLFGDDKALGKTLRFDTLEYQVTGVIKDLPRFSTIRFDALWSLATFEQLNKHQRSIFSWSDIWSNYIYIVLPENVGPSEMQPYLDAIDTEENADNENTRRELRLQRLYDIALGEELSNEIGPTMPVSTVRMIGGLALVVIISACFNYTNLSLARSIRRLKEVGLRKAIGAGRAQVRQQFLYEAIIVSLLALLISFVIFLLLRNQFLAMDRDLPEMVNLELTPVMVGSFIAFSVVVGVLAGFLPALFFARINIIQALKDSSSVKVFKNVNLRRVLVVVQYTLTLMFITATVVGYTQYKTFLAFDLGFETENIINIHINGNKSETLLKEFSELPEVEGISKSSVVSSIGNFSGAWVKYRNMSDSSLTWRNIVDENYLRLHQHKLVAGQGFIARPTTKGAESEVIVNETLVRQFGIAGNDPLKAIGEAIYVNRTRLTIVGVMKDFHYGKVENKIEPVLFSYWIDDPRNGFVNLMIRTTDPVAMMSKIKATWKKIDRIHPLRAEFYNDAIKRSYNEFSTMVKIIGFLSFLAITIASMGLFGMVVFTTETRLKEISIRKVLGATTGNLVLLLGRGFLWLLCISAAIAIPATYIYFERVILADIAFHTPVGAGELFIGLGGVLLIAFVMIGFQTLKAARSNPAEVLKSE